MSNLAYYIVCAVLVAGVLGGIAMMSRVKTAVAGNALSAACTAAAIFVTLYKYHLLTQAGLWVCLALGLAVGIVGAYRVKMIQMPQAVALLNGFGGAASALVAAVSLMEGLTGIFSLVTAGLALAVGMIAARQRSSPLSVIRPRTSPSSTMTCLTSSPVRMDTPRSRSASHMPSI